MRLRPLGIALAAMVLALISGCVGGGGGLRIDARSGGNAALFGQMRAYDGKTGRALSFPALVERCAQADVVFFGEEHSDEICNELEAQLLYELMQRPRPITLAMEFFEADTQADVTAYLRGRISEDEFRDRTRQRSAYVRSHRPLIELCRASHSPVLAANAPRRLVSAYRKSGEKYPVYRALAEPGDQRWLPREYEFITGAYQSRFAEMMSGHGGMTAPPKMPGPTVQPAVRRGWTTTQPASQPTSQPAEHEVHEAPAHGAGMGGFDVGSFYRAQLLWDAAMGENIADARAENPERRVMLVVGVFHVAHDGGTVQNFVSRRPRDRVCTVVYRSTTDSAFDFQAEDRGAGDIVVYGIKAPEEESPSGMRKKPGGEASVEKPHWRWWPVDAAAER